MESKERNHKWVRWENVDCAVAMGSLSRVLTIVKNKLCLIWPRLTSTIAFTLLKLMFLIYIDVTCNILFSVLKRPGGETLVSAEKYKCIRKYFSFWWYSPLVQLLGQEDHHQHLQCLWNHAYTTKITWGIWSILINFDHDFRDIFERKSVKLNLIRKSMKLFFLNWATKVVTKVSALNYWSK